MSIVFYVPEALGGYGDLLFGLKAVCELKKSLQKEGYDVPVYLVTRKKEKEMIVTLGADIEFGVEVKSIEEFNASKDSENLDFFIEGPVFGKKLKIPTNTPVLLVSEYSLKCTYDYEKEKSRLSTMYLNSEAIQSGFDTSDSSELGHGVFFSEELTQAAENKRNNCFIFREQYWPDLEKYSSRLLQGQSIESYHQNTDLSFEYSHNSPWQRHVYEPKSNTCARYLCAHQLFTEGSSKNQDIFSIGKNIDHKDQKKAALIELLPTLKKNGYNKIVYIDLESGTEEILHDEPKSPQKVYRLFHAQQLTHREMIALQALSGPLVGVTGDQSFGEALSCEKLIVYECLPHKQKLAEEFIKTVQALDLDSDKKASRLVELLIKGKITSVNTNQNEVNELRELLQNPKVIQQYQIICRKIQETNNLAESIAQRVVPVVSRRLHSQRKEEHADHAYHNEAQVRLEKSLLPLGIWSLNNVPSSSPNPAVPKEEGFESSESPYALKI